MSIFLKGSALFGENWSEATSLNCCLESSLLPGEENLLAITVRVVLRESLFLDYSNRLNLSCSDFSSQSCLQKQLGY